MDVGVLDAQEEESHHPEEDNHYGADTEEEGAGQLKHHYPCKRYPCSFVNANAKPSHTVPWA